MSNLYEKQALENYLNDGITHGKKISYGSLGRNKNEIPQQPVNYERQNYERQPIVMNIKSNSMRNSNKTNILQQSDNYDTDNYDTDNYDTVNYDRQPIVMNSKPNSMRNSNKTNILQQPDNYDTDNYDTDNFDTVNYERQLVVMNIKSNSTKNENNSKMNVTELEDKTKSIILKQKYELFQKLTQEEQMYENIMRNSNETNILQQPVNYDTVNYEKQPVVMNSTKNENNSKMFITELSDKSKSITLKQKHLMFQKLTKEEQICEHLLNYWPKHEMNGIK